MIIRDLEGTELALGLLMIGMMVGLAGAGLAMIAGAGILAAVSIYAGAGVVSILLVVLVVALRPDVDMPSGPEMYAAE